MPQTTTDERRTYAFSIFNLLGYAGASFGSLLAVIPDLVQEYLNFSLINGHRMLFALFALTGLLLMIVYRSLSHRAEVEVTRISTLGLDKSKRTVAKLSLLFSIDAFGGGFVISLMISLWFKQRYNSSLSAVGAILFVTQIITAASFLLAGPLSRRIGLLNTMVFTHIPSNLLLIGVGLAPTFQTSVAFLLLRQALSQMDVPTRQSYMTAIIPSEERNAANSITNISRSIAAAPPPTISGYLIQSTLWAAPFLLGGVFKTAYDISIYLSFRNVKPPEEENKSRRPLV
jgi:predicted MFS family arabinose efflux permease